MTLFEAAIAFIEAEKEVERIREILCINETKLNNLRHELVDKLEIPDSSDWIVPLLAKNIVKELNKTPERLTS